MRAGPLLLLASAMVGAPCAAASKPDALAEQFASPPTSARPLVYWFWLDGNITEEGLKLDLEWMKRAGLGGFDLFNGAVLTPRVAKRRLPYMSPEWRQALRFAVRKADSLKLEANIQSSPGWSLTGGPWVEPQQAMKKYVWSETRVAGGRPFASRLAQPPSIAGPFQGAARRTGPNGDPVTSPTPFYRDSSVFAYRIPADARRVALGEARLSTNAGKPRLSPVTLAGVAGDALLELPPPTEATPSWVRYDFPRPQTVRSVVVSLALAGYYEPQLRAFLEASEDGVTFRPITEVPTATASQVTLTFAPVTARHFRIKFLPSADGGPIGVLMSAAKSLGVALPKADYIPQMREIAVPPPPVKVLRMALFGDSQVDRFEFKTGFAMADDYYAIASAPATSGSIVHSRDVVDLTGRMRADGTLAWTPPPGDWSIVRLGYSLTGRENIPAAREATGLEVDKLNATHVAAYLNTYLDMIAAAVGPDFFANKGITGLLTDSWESGPQNWTEGMLGEFRRLRGYDPRPFLPALAGHIVDGAETTERFLWDFRRTIAQLTATNHYGTVARVARERGLRVLAEALESGRPALGDDMEMRSHADVPMGALWTGGTTTSLQPVNIADVKSAASVAHVFGRKIIAAESLTSQLQPWAGSPRTLKSAIDAAFALGVNRPTIHCSVHQPLIDKAPGMALAIYGQYFNRNETWAEQARPWIDYIARTSYLLQQGRYHADVAFFYGEEASITALYGQRENDAAPARNGYDYVNADMLLNQIRVQDGALITDSGMRYRVLQLGGSSSRMTLRLLRRLAEFVDKGAVIAGEKPIESPSLADDPFEFRRIADKLWAQAPIAGRGGVIAGRSIDQALAAIGVGPDWEIVGGDSPGLMALHRELQDGDLYFLSNRSGAAARSEVALRVVGRVPELWDADTGRSSSLPYRIENGRTIVTLDFDVDGAAPVVFRQPAASRSGGTVPARNATPLADLTHGWSLSFQPGRGAPQGERAASAGSWSGSAESGIRYFSGTGTYARTIDISAGSLKSDGRIVLALGEVREIAEVMVNGIKQRTLWKPPYRLDVTDALKPGRNRIKVRVTNLWINRLIGDAQPGATSIGFLGATAYLPSAPLAPSGLIGPVTLIVERPTGRADIERRLAREASE